MLIGYTKKNSIDSNEYSIHIKDDESEKYYALVKSDGQLLLYYPLFNGEQAKGDISEFFNSHFRGVSINRYFDDRDECRDLYEKIKNIIDKTKPESAAKDDISKICGDMLLDLKFAGVAEYEACQKLAAAGWRKVAKPVRLRDEKGRFIKQK